MLATEKAEGRTVSAINRRLSPAVEMLLNLPPKARVIAWGALAESENDPRSACTEILIHIGDRTEVSDEIMVEHIARLLTLATGEASELLAAISPAV